MIISHKHKFIFLKTRKTAGTSLEIALSSICGPMDIITSIGPDDEKIREKLGYRTAQNFFVPFRSYSLRDWKRYFVNGERLSYYNHISAEEVKKYLSKRKWKSYYKFSMDRNPFDKVVSFYYWSLRNEKTEENKAFSDFFKTVGFSKINGLRIYGIRGEVAVDRVFKFEELDSMLSELVLKLGLKEPIPMRGINAKSNTRPKGHYREIIDDELKGLIEEYFHKEIVSLNYSY